MCCFCSGPFSFGRIKWFMTSCSVNCFQRFIYLLLAPLSSRLSVESVRWDRESGTVCSGTGPEAIKVQSNNTLKKSRSTSKRDREREQKGRYKINLLTAILAETNRKQQKKKNKKELSTPSKVNYDDHSFSTILRCLTDDLPCWCLAANKQSLKYLTQVKAQFTAQSADMYILYVESRVRVHGPGNSY